MSTLGNPLNFIKVSDPRSLALPHKYLLDGQVPCGVFITGYSAPPDGYAEPTKAYEMGLIENLRAQGKAPVPVTSPTVTPGSVDAISTEVAHAKHTDILYITATDYLPYVDPAQLSPEADRERFVQEPKYFFDDKDDYSLASAASSDLTEVTGGRDTAVKDFMNALQEGKKVILVRNPRLPTGFDTAKSRPHNAEEYLETMIESRIIGQPLPYPPVNGLDGAYMDTHLKAIEKLVKVDDVDHPLYLSAPLIEIVARAAGRIKLSPSAAISGDASRRPEGTPASPSRNSLDS